MITDPRHAILRRLDGLVNAFNPGDPSKPILKLVEQLAGEIRGDIEASKPPNCVATEVESLAIERIGRDVRAVLRPIIPSPIRMACDSRLMNGEHPADVFGAMDAISGDAATR